MTKWLLIFLCFWYISGPGGSSDQPVKPSSEGYYLPFQFSSFSDNPAFYEESYRRARGKRESAKPKSDPRHRIRCAVLSHHLLIADLIAECFLRISAEISPKSIIIIGPNHKSRGKADIAISALRWKTPFGFVQPDLEIVHELNNDRLAKTDEDAFFNEHSIGALAAFVKYSFPKSKLTAIIVRPDVDTATAGRLANWLSRESEKGTLIIASLDFSHYQTSAVAQREDSLTYEIISNFDVARYSDAFVDSRVILFTLLEVCRKSQAYDIELVHHTNSGLMSGKRETPCTSYMNLIFRDAHRNEGSRILPQLSSQMKK